jgi:hypothetical protein
MGEIIGSCKGWNGYSHLSMAQTHQISRKNKLKSPYLDNKLEHVAKT